MAIDRIKLAALADRLEELSSRLKTEWAHRERRASNQSEFTKAFTSPTFEEAGGLLEKALQAGAFRDDADFVREVTRDPSRTIRDGRHRNIFLGLWQRWLPKMGHPYRANGGYDYADALRAFAELLRGDGKQPPKTEGAISQGVFVHNGKRAENIQPAPWRLLEFMEDRLEGDIEEAYQHAADEHGKDSTPAAIKALLSKANDALLEAQYPRHLSKPKNARKIIGV